MDEITPNEVSFYLESLAAKSNKSILDVIVEYCEEFYIDIDDIIPYLNETIISKLETYFIDDGILPKKVSIEDLLC